MDPKTGHRWDRSKMTWGLTLVVVGTLLTLDRTGLADLGHVGRLWPVAFLVIPGVTRVIAPERDGDVSTGVWLLMVGLWLAAHALDILSVRHSWPLLLSAAGVAALCRAFEAPQPQEPRHER